MLPRPRTEWASVEQTIGTPASTRSPHVLAEQVEPVGQAVHLERDARLERDLEDRVEVERVRRPVVEEPARRVREAARGRMAHRLDDPRRSAARAAARWPACRLICTQSSSASTSSGRSSEPSGRMSHSVPRSTRNGASASFAAAISSPWRRTSSASRPGDDAHRPRVVADREVLVAELARGLRPSRAPSPSRPTRSCARAGRRGRPRARAGRRGGVGGGELAQLGRANGQAERREDLLLVGASGSGSERRDVLGRAGRAQELGAEALRRRGDDLDRVALGRDADRAPRVPLEHARRPAAARRRRVPQLSLGTTTAKSRREVAPAARVAGRLAAERGCELADERPGAVQQQPAAAAGRRRLPRAPSRICAAVFGPTPRHALQPAGRRRLAQLVERRGRRAPCPSSPHPLRPRARAAGRRRRAPASPRPRARASSASSPVSTSSRSRASIPGPIPASSRARPARTSAATSAGVDADQLGGAPVGAHGVVARAGEVEQRGEGLEPLGDRGVVHPADSLSHDDGDRRPLPRRRRQERLDAAGGGARAARARDARRRRSPPASRRRRTIVVTDDDGARALAGELGAELVRRSRRRPGRGRRGGARAAARRAGARRQRRRPVRRARTTCARSPSAAGRRARRSSRRPTARRTRSRCRARRCSRRSTAPAAPSASAPTPRPRRRRRRRRDPEPRRRRRHARRPRAARLRAGPRTQAALGAARALVKVALLSGGVGGARFARGLVDGASTAARRDGGRQRRRRRRGARPRTSRPTSTASSTRSPACTTRSAAGGAPARRGARSRPPPSSAARTGSGSATATSASTSCARRRCGAASRSRP